jgi:predicted RNA-binding Zn ribbon-like protein
MNDSRLSTATARQRPPHGLGLVIEFANTFDPEAGSDSIASPVLLHSWLVERRLVDRTAPRLIRGQLARAVSLREALRSLMLANNGGPRDERSPRAVEGAARRGKLSVQFGADGTAAIASLASGFDAALADLLVPVVLASLDGSWRRVKACREPQCREVFYDRSRNRSGVWCDMALCGNRTKVRGFRARARGEPDRPARAADEPPPTSGGLSASS